MEKIEKLKEFFHVNSDGPYIVLSDKDEKNNVWLYHFETMETQYLFMT